MVKCISRQNNYEGVAGKVLDISGLKADMNYHMEWNDEDFETGETNVRHNNCEEVAGQVLNMLGLKSEMNYDMKWDWTYGRHEL